MARSPVRKIFFATAPDGLAIAPRRNATAKEYIAPYWEAVGAQSLTMVTIVVVGCICSVAMDYFVVQGDVRSRTASVAENKGFENSIFYFFVYLWLVTMI